MSLFSFNTAVFPFQPKNISDVITHTYTEAVAETVQKFANQDSLDLATLDLITLDHIRPATQTVIASQRRDYGFITKETEFPITEQADYIDEVPVHNLKMQNTCGATAVRIDKLTTVEAAS